VVPSAEPGHARAFFVAGGRVAAERTLPPGGGAHLEVEAGLAAARRALTAEEAGDLDELFLVGTFLRRPPAELFVVTLDKDAILAAAARVVAPRAKAHTGPGPGSDPKPDPKAGTLRPDEPSLF
jgi:hypothetical protein